MGVSMLQVMLTRTNLPIDLWKFPLDEFFIHSIADIQIANLFFTNYFHESIVFDVFSWFFLEIFDDSTAVLILGHRIVADQLALQSR